MYTQLQCTITCTSTHSVLLLYKYTQCTTTVQVHTVYYYCTSTHSVLLLYKYTQCTTTVQVHTVYYYCTSTHSVLLLYKYTQLLTVYYYMYKYTQCTTIVHVHTIINSVHAVQGMQNVIICINRRHHSYSHTTGGLNYKQ